MTIYTFYLEESKQRTDSNLENEIIIGGLSGIKKAMSHVHNEAAVVLLKTISVKMLNNIASSETYKSHLREWLANHGDEVKDTKKAVADLILFVEGKMNQSILSAKKSDTKHKRQLEKKIVMNFYQSYKNDLKKLFDLYNMIKETERQ